MKLLFASDSFKGTLSSQQIIRLLKASAEKIFPGCETVGVPIADGGEGTVEAVITVTGGKYRQVKVHGPLMEETTASYGVFHGDRAVIEMAAVRSSYGSGGKKKSSGDNDLWNRRADS